MTVRDARFLAYAERNPRLRAVRLPGGDEEASPVSLDMTGSALDHCYRRDGWIAFGSFGEQFGVPISLKGEAFRVGHWWDLVPAVNERTVWVACDYDDQNRWENGVPGSAVEYDGLARAEVSRLELPPRFRLDAAVPRGLVIRLLEHDYCGPLSLWHPDRQEAEPLTEAKFVSAQHGAVLAADGPDRELYVLDTSTGQERIFTAPSGMDWDHHISTFAPSGEYLVTALRTSFDRQIDQQSELQLLVLRLREGELVPIEGATANVGRPVWTRDGTRFVIWTWGNRWLVCEPGLRAPRLEPVDCQLKSVPLVDITDL